MRSNCYPLRPPLTNFSTLAVFHFPFPLNKLRAAKRRPPQATQRLVKHWFRQKGETNESRREAHLRHADWVFGYSRVRKGANNSDGNAAGHVVKRQLHLDL